jgi:hypothetical protein
MNQARFNIQGRQKKNLVSPHWLEKMLASAQITRERKYLLDARRRPVWDLLENTIASPQN